MELQLNKANTSDKETYFIDTENNIKENRQILYSLSNMIQDLTLDETSLETRRSFPQCIVRVAILFGAVSLDKFSTQNMSHFIINSVNFMYY